MAKLSRLPLVCWFTHGLVCGGLFSMVAALFSTGPGFLAATLMTCGLLITHKVVVYVATR